MQSPVGMEVNRLRGTWSSIGSTDRLEPRTFDKLARPKVLAADTEGGSVVTATKPVDKVGDVADDVYQEISCNRDEPCGSSGFGARGFRFNCDQLVDLLRLEWVALRTELNGVS